MRVAKSYVGYEYDETKAYEKNGKMYVSARCKCDRCNGSGIAISHVCNGQPVPYVNDGGICYSCNGAGYFRKEIRLYTDKEFEQMEKASAKAAEKREAAREQKMKAEYANKRAKWLEENGFNENGITWIYAKADSYEKKDILKQLGMKFSKNLLWHAPFLIPEIADACVKIDIQDIATATAWGEYCYNPNVNDIIKSKMIIEKSDSEWIEGKINDRIQIKVSFVSKRIINTRFGLTNLYTFISENKNKIQWWSQTNIDFPKENIFTLAGTIKDFNEFKNEKITTLTRCKIK